MKVSIIMPVYNEEKHINEAISSVINQSYESFDLLVVDDGSTDNTVALVNSFGDSRIKVFQKENGDQLNAIFHVLDYVNGDLVYLFHGDDRVHCNDTIEKLVSEISQSGADFIEYPYCTMDANGCIKNTVRGVKDLKLGFSKANHLLYFGRNYKTDPFFCRLEFFRSEVVPNYIERNIPFWSGCETPNITNVDFPVFDYRLHDGNYLNQESGLLNVINGNIRSTLNLLSSVYVPFFELQRFLFKVFYKCGYVGIPVFHMKKGASKQYKLKVIYSLLGMYSIDIEKYSILELVIQYLEQDFTREIDVCALCFEQEWGPRDIRRFNKVILSGDPSALGESYVTLLSEIEKGVGVINCSAQNKANVIKFCDLLNVEIEIR